jgi:ribosomal protein S18 acetylase RimI-like enzyme
VPEKRQNDSSDGNGPIHIHAVKEINDEILDAMHRLLPQLSPNRPLPTREQLAEILAAPHSILYIARDLSQNGFIVGALTLVIFRVPTGLRARIEDVVVGEAERGRGIGAALTMKAIETAAQAGTEGIDLTSNPRREAANRLYQRLGFDLRRTNVYHYTFNEPHPTDQAHWNASNAINQDESGG